MLVPVVLNCSSPSRLIRQKILPFLRPLLYSFFSLYTFFHNPTISYLQNPLFITNGLVLRCILFLFVSLNKIVSGFCNPAYWNLAILLSPFASMEHARAEQLVANFEEVRKWINEWFCLKDK